MIEGIIYLCIFSAVQAVPNLGSFNVDSSQISVSGISSGAAMATQLHVALSNKIMGVGLVAGVPYMCSEGLLAEVVVCMKTPSLISISVLEGITSSAALIGNIDSTRHMANDRVYIFAGTKDSVVNPGAGKKTESFYKHYIKNSGNIKTVYNIAAEHSMPSADYGGPCDQLSKTNYINNCGYSAAFDLLNHIYGGHLVKPTSTNASGQLLTFDQGDFFYFSLPVTYSMDSVGYVYIPTGCANKQSKCKLHVALHGCAQGRTKIGEDYVRHSGYNEVAEVNNIIILYPQVVATPLNLQGCWDWFGYTGILFATKNGFQITAIRRMIDHIM